MVFFENLWDLFVDMSFYLVIGIIFTGILHAFVNKSVILKHVGGNSFVAVLKASVVGVPLPLCSCGVVPMALYIGKNGASKGATVSFLTSTPQTGVDSIIATTGMLGGFFAAYRAIVAFISGIIAGCATNLFCKNDKKDLKDSIEIAPSGCGCCGTLEEKKEEEHCCCGSQEAKKEEEHCCCGTAEVKEEEHCCCGSQEPKKEEEHCCCGTAEVKEEEHSCCSQEPKKEEHCCCGTAEVKEEEHCCCGSTEAKKEEEHCCCGTAEVKEEEHCCCGSQEPKKEEHCSCGSQEVKEKPTCSCCADLEESSGCSCTSGITEPAPKKTFLQKVKSIFTYGFGGFLDEITVNFIIGIVIAALITTLVPTEVFTYFSNPFLQMLLMLVVGIPMYVCSTASIPIAVALVIKGISPGAAFVFLFTGPVTNIASLTMLTKNLGKKVMAIYLSSVALCSMMFGFILNLILELTNYTGLDEVLSSVHGSSEPVYKIVVAGVFGVLVLFSLYRKLSAKIKQKKQQA